MMQPDNLETLNGKCLLFFFDFVYSSLILETI